MELSDNYFQSKTAAIICHDSVFGPPHELRDYLIKMRIKKLLFIGHPSFSMPNNPVKSSFLDIYEDGIKINRIESKIFPLPEYLAYIRDFILTLYWCVSIFKNRIDIFVGLGNLNAFSGLVLKILGRSKSVIYYVIDYVPVRFSNKIINSFYHNLDKYCVIHCNFTWNYSRNMIKQREKYWGTSYNHQLVVPNGVNVDTINHKYNLHNHDLIYIGSLFKRQGIDLVIKTIPKLFSKYSDIRFFIIGQGPYLNELINLCQKMNVVDRVIFLGFIDNPKKADQIIQKCSLGMATYETSHEFVGYTEPGKVKRYLACGIPVVMTQVSEITQDLVKYKCGFVIHDKPEELEAVIADYFKNSKIEHLYRRNAIRYASKFTWNSIFTDAFNLMKL
jgi:glycosyltransferase involved in cell wall biosynthesis